MQITAKGKIALAFMADLAGRVGQGPISLAAVAWRFKVSLSYLENLSRDLRAKNLIRATRGPGGGYELGRDAADISVTEILHAVDPGPTQPALALAKREFGLEDQITVALYQRAEAEIENYLSTITLLAVVQQGLAEQSDRQELLNRHHHAHRTDSPALAEID
jgi:Rrf2 family transcriptional regulator, iron-sulfur cluster assembly transcription factor